MLQKLLNTPQTNNGCSLVKCEMSCKDMIMGGSVSQEKSSFKCWDCLFLLNWIQVLILPLFGKLGALILSITFPFSIYRMLSFDL